MNCTTRSTLHGFWDRTFKDDGTPAHFFWDVASDRQPAAQAADHARSERARLRPLDDGDVCTIGAIVPQIDRIDARIRIRPSAYAVLDDLIASGDLDPAFVRRSRRSTAEARRATWTKATGRAPARDEHELQSVAV